MGPEPGGAKPDEARDEDPGTRRETNAKFLGGGKPEEEAFGTPTARSTPPQPAPDLPTHDGSRLHDGSSTYGGSSSGPGSTGPDASAALSSQTLDAQAGEFALQFGSPLSGADTLNATGSVGSTSSSSSAGPTSDSALEQMLNVVREPARAETVADTDSLNRENLALAVANLFVTRAEKHPLSVALFGAWGSGKTSFIGFVEKFLISMKADFRVAQFNAWRNERVDNIGAALAQAVVERLVRDLSFWQQFKLALKLSALRRDRLRKAMSKDASKLRATLQRWWFWASTVLIPFSLPLAVLLVFSIATLQASEQLRGLFATLTTLATGVSTWVATHLVLSKELLNWFKQLAKDQKLSLKLLPDYSEKLGSFHEMGRTLEDLCALTLGPSDDAAGSLLLVVDDLDRCSPDTVKQVFDAVRLVASIQKVVVIVALDQRIAFSAVAKHFSEYGFSDQETEQVARDYLAKVFNVSVTLPNVRPGALRTFVREKLFGMQVRRFYGGGSAFPSVSPPNLEESSKEVEAETFEQLVKQFELTNPRELWRLRQAWSLLKTYALEDRTKDEQLRVWMQHLFFREVFLRGSSQEREAGTLMLRPLMMPGPDSQEPREPTDSAHASSEEHAGAPTPEPTTPWERMVARAAKELAEGFAQRDAAVLAVLLPASPGAIRTSAKKPS